ncbi:MAG: M23 family metallopeptidase [Actinomycetota bacterium]|nr:M23 family metallopeptidase [Actinomycetota bacterium]
MLAHVRQNSVRVEPGASVRAGQHIADCGNSGTSAELQLHLQLMDHPWIAVAAGLPVKFDDYEIEGSRRCGVSGNGQPFVVASAR